MFREKTKAIMFVLIMILAVGAGHPCSGAEARKAPKDPAGRQEAGVTNARAIALVVSFTKASPRKADAYIYVEAGAVRDRIISRITLQEAPAGSSNYTDSPPAPKVKVVYNTSSLIDEVRFPIRSGRNYRIKVEATETAGSTTLNTIHYEYLR